MSNALAELEAFLNSKEADHGMNEKARVLISGIPGDEDEAFKYFANIVVPSDDGDEEGGGGGDTTQIQDAARSYRAMQLLKQDLATMPGYPRALIKNPAQAGLLAKDLFAGLSVPNRERYSTLHMRELLDALVEAYPEKVMAAASAGGKQGIQEHLTPLLSSDQTLPVLTHLVCYGCTGRKGIASAEKSAAHTQRMYHHQAAKIPMGHRKKFVRACMDFGLMDQLASALTASTAEPSAADIGEEVCEAILTTIELIGYPPDDAMPPHMQQQQASKKDEVMVGEDALLSPIATPEWWTKLLECLQQPTCSAQQRLAISRTCMQAFSLATGHSSRICKSHAPATDATEQTSEKIVEEKEEHLTNRLVEWGLTDNIHAALVTQIPLIVQALQLPDRDILSYNATFSATTEDSEQGLSTIRHPGKYATVPLGSWRLQLLSLLKEILVFGSGEKRTVAMDEVMKLPLPSELVKAKKGSSEEAKVDEDGRVTVFNPWPALCSYIWAYPNNDFYGIIFFEMFRSAVMEHHEATLRVILQKSKFLTKAVKTLVDSPGSLRGVLLNCLNLLRLRALSLPPNAFLPQYLKSHDGWKEHVDRIIEMTIIQQTPIKGDGIALSIGLGSKYAQQLGMESVEEYDEVEAKAAEDAEKSKQEAEEGKKSGGKKKKKNNKKKKK